MECPECGSTMDTNYDDGFIYYECCCGNEGQYYIGEPTVEEEERRMK